MTPTQLVLSDEVHVKQVYGPPTTSRVKECNVLFPRNEEWEVDVKRGVYETNNQPKRATFKYNKEGRFCIGVAKVESKYGKIIGKRCPELDYTDKRIVTIDAYKNNLNEFTGIRKLTSSLSPWVKKIKLTRYGSVNL